MDDLKEKGLLFTRDWNNELLKNMGQHPEEDIPSLMHHCSEYHYRSLDMDTLLQAYIGDLPAFLNFLEKEWNWIITYDETKRMITANENKDFCVCPVVSASEGHEVSPVLCHCSEGFASRMFSKVLGHAVKAEVISSVLRKDKNCIYQIRI